MFINVKSLPPESVVTISNVKRRVIILSRDINRETLMSSFSPVFWKTPSIIKAIMAKARKSSGKAGIMLGISAIFKASSPIALPMK